MVEKLQDLARSGGVSIVAALSLVIVVIGGCWFVFDQLARRDAEISNLTTDLALARADRVVIQGRLTELGARVDSERDFSAGHRVRLFDRVQQLEARETARAQDMALIKQDLARVADNVDRLVNRLLDASETRTAPPRR